MGTESLAAGVAGTDSLVAGVVSTESLAAGVVHTTSLAANFINPDALVAGVVDTNSLTVGLVDANRLISDVAWQVCTDSEKAYDGSAECAGDIIACCELVYDHEPRSISLGGPY